MRAPDNATRRRCRPPRDLAGTSLGWSGGLCLGRRVCLGFCFSCGCHLFLRFDLFSRFSLLCLFSLLRFFPLPRFFPLSRLRLLTATLVRAPLRCCFDGCALGGLATQTLLQRRCLLTAVRFDLRGS